MRSTHWSLLVVLALLNYIVLASLFGVVSDELSMGAPPTRTPWPSFTPTFRPPLIPFTIATPTATRVLVMAPTPYAQLAMGRTTHVVQPGENLPDIAQRYGVSSGAILHMNGILDPSGLRWGQMLVIPGANEPLDTPTPTETPTPTPTNTRKPRPPTNTPPATSPPVTPTPREHQFTGEVVAWYANCGATGVHKPSKIVNLDGEPLNGLRVRIWYESSYEAYSLVAGIGGNYDPGEYDIAMRSGESGKFKVAVWDWQTGPDQFSRVDSEVLDVEFDYNSQDCQPGRKGHQSVVINWTRHW